MFGFILRCVTPGRGSGAVNQMRSVFGGLLKERAKKHSAAPDVLKEFIDSMPLFMVLFRKVGNRFVAFQANERAHVIFGGAKNIYGVDISKLFGNHLSLKSCLDTPYKADCGQERIVKVKGRYLEVSLFKPSSDLIVAAGRDVTKKVLMQENLKEEHERYRVLTENVELGIFLVSADHTVLYANPFARDVIKHICGRASGINLLEFIAPEFRKSVIAALEDVLDGRPRQKIDVKLMPVEGKLERWLSFSFSSIQLKNNPFVLVSCMDVTDFYLQKKELEYLSFHDSLTGVYNRRYFSEELRRLLNSRNEPVALILIDLDGLKIINDLLGHMKGDEALSAVAGALKDSLRQNDVLARIGGDEFAIIAIRTDEHGVETLMKRMRESVKAASEATGIPLSISYGYAIYSRKHARSANELFTEADRMLYRMKRSMERRERLKLMMEELARKKGSMIDASVADYLLNR